MNSMSLALDKFFEEHPEVKECIYHPHIAVEECGCIQPENEYVTVPEHK